jgi:alpha-galactosidase
MRRAVPFWRSDYQVEPTGAQCQTYGISYWLPYYGAALDPQVTRAGSWGSAAYVTRSSFAPCLISNILASSATSADWDLLRRVNEEFLKIKDDLLYSDYYPLTPYSLGDDVWMAMQFHRPEAGQGVVEVFRRALSSTFYQNMRLAGLDARRSYRVTNLVLGNTEVRTGRSLMESGLAVVFADAPDAAIFSYTALT